MIESASENEINWRHAELVESESDAGRMTDLDGGKNFDVGSSVAGKSHFCFH